ncbi:MAG: sensor domain-containing diguanylate cyclase [Candidatus Omnitrophica bacterium]|nr:sensor domain-containing diguanylate cyclase [Candidatus Omnitrophota bacterium]
MFTPIFTIIIILICILTSVFFIKKAKAQDNKIKALEKETEIKINTLNYEKTQHSTSINQLHSITIMIMEMVEEISFALSKEKEILEKDVLAVIFEKLKSLFKTKRCILFTLNLKADSLFSLFSFGYNQEELNGINLSLAKQSDLAGWSVATGRFISVYDAEKDPALRHLLENNPLHCHYFQPIKVDGITRALICVGRIEEGLPPVLVSRLFSILANLGAVALRNAMLTQQLRQQSIRDGLTGLYNHTYFQKWLNGILTQPAGEVKTLVLAMADLDDFKKINDTYGHLAGDSVLKTVAGFLQNLDNTSYLCARHGGEEFILGFLNREAKDIFALLDKFRQEVAQEKFNIEVNLIQVTISIGLNVAVLSEGKSISRSELIARADKALYQAKLSGKNKVIMAEV